MPVFTSGFGKAPDWSELDFFEILKPGGLGSSHDRQSEKEIIFAGAGSCRIRVNGMLSVLNTGDIFEIPDSSGSWSIEEAADCTLIHVGGRWQDNCGGRGVFTLEQSSTPRNIGTPVPYQRNTDFDNHYHDCDEYWIIFGGRGEVVTEGKRFSIKAGDCVATRSGEHHDFPLVTETIQAVYFETTLRGLEREGHLWDKNI